MPKQIIHTNDAPKAVGTYSQAVKVGNTVYISGQIVLHPVNMTLRDGFVPHAKQVVDHIAATAPYPARAALEVAALPKGALVEIEAILYIE